MELQTTGRHFNFVPTEVGEGLSQATINIIESNTGTQVDHKQQYVDMTLDANGKPSIIKVWEDDTETKLLWTTTFTFVNGKPSQIVKVNEDDGITETVEFNFTPTRIEVRKT